MATTVLTTSEWIEDLQQQTADAEELSALDWLATDDVPTEEAENWQPPARTPDDVALLQYTSGSSGTPKGVVVSHRNLLHNSEYLKTCFELTTDSVSVTWLPNFHDMGLVDGILQPPCGCFAGTAVAASPAVWAGGAIVRNRHTLD